MVRVDPQRRSRLVEEFERSEMTAVAFARRHRLNYTTFCGWLHRHRRAAQPAFVEVEVLGQPSGGGLVLELGSQARVRLEDESQVELLARLIKACNSTGAC
jgi:hypothetical protein